MTCIIFLEQFHSQIPPTYLQCRDARFVKLVAGFPCEPVPSDPAQLVFLRLHEVAMNMHEHALEHVVDGVNSSKQSRAKIVRGYFTVSDCQNR